MSILKWEDPPASSDNRKRWESIFATLRQHPGRWALARKASSRDTAVALACSIRKGRIIKSIREGEFEAQAHGVFVYVRYVPAPLEGRR